jgi:predicted porin
MKKNLLALAAMAAMAASGAAMAQSNVTVYGLVDAYVGSTKDTTKTANAPSQSVVGSGGLKTSRWGIKGSEDLGGGLKAGFQLEQGFNSDDGSAGANGVQFDRRAQVSLSGSFGTVVLGRTYTPYYELRDATDNTAGLNIGSARDTFKTARADYSDKLSNVIAYASPNFSGFSGAIAVGLGENKNDPATNANSDATNHVSLHLKYANGPLLVGYGHQSEKALKGAKSTDYNLFAASYDFGVAKLVGSYQDVDHAAGKDKDYQFGVSAPVGGATVFFGYANAKSENLAGATAAKATGYDLAASYPLSKRTDLYAGYKAINKKNGAGVKSGEIRVLALGVRHVF